MDAQPEVKGKNDMGRPGKNYIKQNNLAAAKEALKKALEIAIKLIEASVGNERSSYMTKAKTVAGWIDQINKKFEMAEAEAKQTVTTATSPAAAAKPSAEPSADGINYVVNGIDVKGFLSNEANDPVTFDDVKGMEREKALIQREFFISEEQRAFNEEIGLKPKNFILLFGVPGTGKTFFAKAVSEELKRHAGNDIPFFSVVGSQLSDCKVGATEKNIQAIFEFCKQFPRCVLFLDEFDTLAPDRKQATGDPTAASRVTTLLQMLDGFGSAKGTLLIAATNCPYNLDGAVLSRCNTRIEIPLPSFDVIIAVLKAKIGKRIAPDVNLDLLAKRLEQLGYSNRDIKNFIANMQDSLSDEFRKCGGRSEGGNAFLYTNAMIEKAFAEIVPTTKQSDIRRIMQFKEDGE